MADTFLNYLKLSLASGLSQPTSGQLYRSIVSIILPIALLLCQFPESEVKLLSVQRSKRGTHALCSPTQQKIRSVLQILPQRLVRSPSLARRLSCGAACLMLPPCLLYPVSAPLGMQARGSWHPQLETAAQMRPALLHVCRVPLTGN